MNRIHAITHDGPICNPLLVKDRETFNANDTLVIDLPDGSQQSFKIDFVAREKVNKGWCYLLLASAPSAPVLVEKPDAELSTEITG